MPIDKLRTTTTVTATTTTDTTNANNLALLDITKSYIPLETQDNSQNGFNNTVSIQSSTSVRDNIINYTNSEETKKKKDLYDQMCNAVIKNDLPLIKHLYENGCDLNQTSEGKTILHTAVLNNVKAKVMKFLIDRCSNCSRKDAEGQTPLHLACGEFGILEHAYLLATKGSYINMRDNKQNTPLSNALTNGNSLVVCMLLDEGAKTDTTHKDGDNLLHIVARATHFDKNTCEYLACMLIANKVPRECKNTDKKTPYQLACDLNNKNFLQAYQKIVEAIKKTAIVKTLK